MYAPGVKHALSGLAAGRFRKSWKTKTKKKYSQKLEFEIGEGQMILDNHIEIHDSAIKTLEVLLTLFSSVV